VAQRFGAALAGLKACATSPRPLIWTCLLLLIALAWLYLVHLDRQMAAAMQSTGMDPRMVMAMPHTAADLALSFAMWTVMMIGMMAGSAAPVLLLFANAQAARTNGRVSLTVLMFGAGYLAVWVGFSAAAALAQEALHRSAQLSMAMAAASPRVAGAILIAAGAYQLTPVKGACLTECRSPLGILMSNWRDGAVGAFQMGSRHGLSCLGCCWALMGVLFAVGVMNLVWVAALTALVLVEKLSPAGAIVARAAGVLMIAFGGFQIVS
jgi:predicted metal-binding membrane protein